MVIPPSTSERLSTRSRLNYCPTLLDRHPAVVDSRHIRTPGYVIDVIVTIDTIHFKWRQSTCDVMLSLSDVGQAEEMIQEWISLVVERDKLLKQQLDKVCLHNVGVWMSNAQCTHRCNI